MLSLFKNSKKQSQENEVDVASKGTKTGNAGIHFMVAG
jgi:hypothetical protein